MAEQIETRHFITVDWCNNGQRGIFCDMKGGAVSKEEPFTEAEMHKAPDVFWLILNPRSAEFTQEEVRAHSYWRPLAEYCNEFGIATREEDVPHGDN